MMWGDINTSGNIQNIEDVKEKNVLGMENDALIPVPLVKLSIENITYCPLTTSYPKNRLRKYNPVNKKKGSDVSPILERKTILKNVTPPIIQPYQLQAWMGPSGSGKTTLLSIAAGVIEPDRDPGAFSDQKSRILINDEPINFLRKRRGDKANLFPKRLIGVVWQDDVLLSNLTVRETIEFAAKLKTSPSNNHRIFELVNQVLDDLSLTSVQHSLIGQSSLGEGRGISGGERKRVSVAQELVTRPSLIFLDEPTSGLDSTSALELMLALKNLALRGGHSIVTIVHQPRTTIFELMDGLLLLSKGEEVYSGPATGAQSVLESCPVIGYSLPPQTNLADWIIDLIKKDEARVTVKNNYNSKFDDSNNNGDSCDEENAVEASYTDRCLPRHWLQIKASIRSNGSPFVQENIKSDRQGLRRLSSMIEIQSNIPKYTTSFATQLRLLTRRSIKQTRGERIQTATLISQSAFVIFETLLWFRMDDDTNHIYERCSLLFFFMIAQANGLITQSVPIFRRDRALVSRERSKKMYRVLPYYLAQTLAEMTSAIFLPLCHVMIVYWTTNLRPGAGPFFKFVVLFYLTLTCAQSIGYIVSAAIPSLQIALIITPVLSIFLLILGGFYIPLSNIPVSISWMNWLSFASYGYSAFLINEFGGRTIPCAADAVSVSIGGSSEQCPKSGDDVLEALGITGMMQYIWFNILMMIVLQALCRWGAYLLLRRSP